MNKPVVGLMVTAAEHFPYDQPKALDVQARQVLGKLNLELVHATDWCTIRKEPWRRLPSSKRQAWI